MSYLTGKSITFTNFYRNLASAAELGKVLSSASVLVRKDFGIGENLRKAPGGKKIESPTIIVEEKTQRKND